MTLESSRSEYARVDRVLSRLRGDGKKSRLRRPTLPSVRAGRAVSEKPIHPLSLISKHLLKTSLAGPKGEAQ